MRKAKTAHPTPYFTPEDLLGEFPTVGRSGIYNGLRRGDFPGAFQLGQRWLIPRVTVERMRAGERVHADQLGLFDPDAAEGGDARSA